MNITVFAKAFYKSKTIILNALVILAGLLAQVSEMQLGFTEASWFVSLVAAVNIALRFVTKAPVATTDQMVDVSVTPPRSL